MASTTAMMALGDAIAAVLLEERGFTESDFALLHPGGALGRRLVRVEELMRKGDAMPRVPADAPLAAVLAEMTAKRLGMTIVVDVAGALAGIVTDGDLRRALGKTADGRRARRARPDDPESEDASRRARSARRRGR
jgi:arabinose-5-phosphate isomerase